MPTKEYDRAGAKALTVRELYAALKRRSSTSLPAFHFRSLSAQARMIATDA
jgi:hypothetical protein